MPEEAEDSLPSDDGARMESPEEKLSAMDQRIDELTETLKRTQAEFENYKKRMEREWAERTKLATERIVTDLLPTLDTLDKAEEVVNSGDSDEEAHAQGIRHIRRQLLQTLQRAGLKEVDTSVPFDPFMHEALMREEKEDEDGTILEVFQKGYMMGTKVIRTAKVKVATRRDCGQTPSEADDLQIDDQDRDQGNESNKEE